VCNKLHHPEISPDQGASKNYKNISTDGEVMSKIKVACFFWDTVYFYFYKIGVSYAEDDTRHQL